MTVARMLGILVLIGRRLAVPLGGALLQRLVVPLGGALMILLRWQPAVYVVLREIFHLACIFLNVITTFGFLAQSIVYVIIFVVRELGRS